MADYKEFDHTQFGSGQIYPLQNPLKKGYGVASPDSNPAFSGRVNGRFVNQTNEKIDFWIEDIETSFGMTGTKAQSRNLREFMPHNINQPSVTISGRAPNSFQLNRLGAFIRSAQWNGLNTDKLGEALRHEVTSSGQTVQVNTIRFILRNGKGAFPYNGKHVKGVHNPWVLEGYVKEFKAGAQRFNQAPQFKFEFWIAESRLSNSIGIWNDSRVFGSELKPWLDWIKKDGNFVTVHDKAASTQFHEEKKKSTSQPEEREVDGPPNTTIFDPPNWGAGEFE